jgi:hypothetical protein
MAAGKAARRAAAPLRPTKVPASTRQQLLANPSSPWGYVGREGLMRVSVMLCSS